MEGILNWGIDVILQIQKLSPAMDVPFTGITFLGSEPFFLLFLPAIYWCVDRGLGVRLAVLFLVSTWINSAVKVFAGQPRPQEYDSRVKPIGTEEGNGFPSGHTQNAVVLWCYLAFYFKKPWFWAVAAALMILIPFSRMHLGVHFPTDLFGGYVIGAVVLFAFMLIEPSVGKWLYEKGAWITIACVVIASALLLWLSPDNDKGCISSASTLMGMGIGFVLERRMVRFSPSNLIWKRIAGYILGVVVIVGLWGGLKAAFAGMEPGTLFRFIRYFLVGLWCAFGAPWVFVKIKLA